MTPVRLRAIAEADILAAFLWYEERRKGLGTEFRSALDEAFERIGAGPKLYPVLHRDTRRSLVKRFPYAVFYRIIGGEVVVVACLHASRDPRVWRARR